LNGIFVASQCREWRKNRASAQAPGKVVCKKWPHKRVAAGPRAPTTEICFFANFESESKSDENIHIGRNIYNA